MKLLTSFYFYCIVWYRQSGQPNIEPFLVVKREPQICGFLDTPPRSVAVTYSGPVFPDSNQYASFPGNKERFRRT